MFHRAKNVSFGEVWLELETLPLGDSLNKRRIASGLCFCLKMMEHIKHGFLLCQVARMVWSCINLVRMSLIGVMLSSFDWVFAHMEKKLKLLLLWQLMVVK